MIRRQSSTVDLGSALYYSKYLSKFQVEKFKYMFNSLFDLDKNELIENSDIKALANKIQDYTGWQQDDGKTQSTNDIMRTFLECLQDQVKAEQMANSEALVISNWEDARKPERIDTTTIALNQWLNMWGKLCYGASGISDFPCWVQLLPSLFFKVIDTNNDGILDVNELRRFYKDFVGIVDENVEKIVQEGFRAMTANGDHKLTQENYAYCWANFLLGRSIYGPGKYLFGVFDNREIDQKYVINYAEMEN